MRILKVAAWVLGGVLALLIMGIVWLSVWFDPNRYKSDIEQLVKAKTGRTLSLQGDLKLAFWPTLAVELGETTLGNAPGFGTEPMLSVKQVRLGVKVLPLLHKRFEVGAVELDSPVVVLINNAQGVNNWSDLSKHDQPDQQSDANAAAKSDNFNASVERISIKRAALSYDDQAAHTQTRINDFSLTTDKLEAGKPVSLDTAFTIDKTAADRSTQSMKVQLTTRIDADLEASRYELKKPTLEVTLTRQGKSLPVTLKADTVQADLKQQTAQIAALVLTARSFKLDADLNATHIVDAPQLSGHLSVSPFSPRELATALGITMPATRDPKVLQTLSMQAQFNATKTTAGFKSLSMKLDDTTLKGSLAVTDIATKALRFNLDVDRINIDRYLSPASEASQATEENSESEPVKLPAEAVRDLNILGQLRIGEAVFRNVVLTAVRLGLDARNDKLRLNPVQANVYEGQLKGDMLLDASDKVPRVAVEEHVAGVNFAPLFKALYRTERVSGRGNVNLKLAGSGIDSVALKRTLSGTVDFNIDHGAYEGVDLWYEIRRARALLRQQPIPARSGAARTAFNTLRGSGVMTNGVLNNQDLNAALQYLKVTGQGTADLVKNTIDYHLQAAVLKFPSEAKLAAGTQDTGDDLVGLTIPITVTGPLNDPKVRPDVTGLLKERAKQELEKQKDKAEEKLKQKLQDKLRGLLGG